MARCASSRPRSKYNLKRAPRRIAPDRGYPRYRPLLKNAPAGFLRARILPKTPQSWTVVAVAEDGKRYGSGARFETKEEARAYMVHAHRPLWEYAINEIRIAPSQDNPNCEMDRFDKGRDKGKVRPVCRVLFAHDTCGNLGWGEIDAAGNVVWDEFSACEDHASDGLDTDYLKRPAP